MDDKQQEYPAVLDILRDISLKAKQNYLKDKQQSLIPIQELDNCTFEGYFPKKQSLSSFIKVEKATYRGLKDLINQLEGQAQIDYPGVKIYYCLKGRSSFIKTKARTTNKRTKDLTLINKQPFHLICKTSRYKCKAKLAYEYDESEKCFFLTHCQNQHQHYLTNNFKELMKQRWKNLEKMKKSTKNVPPGNFYQAENILRYQQLQNEYLKELCTKNNQKKSTN